MKLTAAIKLAFIGLLAAMSFAIRVAAWDDEGHMMVAAIAYDHLNPDVRSRVDHLLTLNPYYNTWTSMLPQGISETQRNKMVFMLAATWPDAIKRDNAYQNDGADNGDRPSGPEASQNIGYSDHLRHKYWHFVDRPFSQDGTALEQPTTPNAETQIAEFRRILASGSPDPLKSYDLSWLLHLIGDVHQPLHCASRFSQSEPHGDAGGNRVKLCAPPCRDELHAFWDDVLGTSHSPSVALTAAAALHLNNADTNAANDTTTGDWIDESFQLAKENVYSGPIGAGDGPFSVTPAYRQSARKIAERRVTLAGFRLAAVLNSELR